MYKEYFVYNFNVLNIPAGNGTIYNPAVARIDSDADFEFMKVAYQATSGQIRARLRDDSVGRYLTRTDFDLRALGGNFIGTPFIWPRPYGILAGTTFTAELAEGSGFINNLYASLHGCKIRVGEEPWRKHYRALVPFVYGTGKVTIPALQTQSFNVPIDRDAHFLVQKITGVVNHQEMLIEVKESAGDKNWMNTATRFTNFVGNGEFPNILPYNGYRFIFRGSVVVIQFQDQSGFDNDVEVNFVGIKYFE